MRNGKGLIAVFGAAALIAGVCIANSNGLLADTDPNSSTSTDSKPVSPGWKAKPARFDSRFNQPDETIVPANGKLTEVIKDRIRKKYPQDSKILPFEFRAAREPGAEGQSADDQKFWSSLEELKRKRDRHNVHADYEKDKKKTGVRTVQAADEDMQFEVTPFEVIEDEPSSVDAIGFEEPVEFPSLSVPADNETDVANPLLPAEPNTSGVATDVNTQPVVTFPNLTQPVVARPVTSTGTATEIPTTPVVNTGSDSTSTVETGVSPVVSVQWVKSGPVNVGQETDCFLVVRNSGKGTAGNVAVDAFFPASVELVKVDPKPEANGEFMTWSFGELDAGQERRVHVQMVPRERGNLQTRAFVRYSGQANGQFTVREPKVDISIRGPQKSLVDDACPHVITISNPGDGVAQNAIIRVAIPPGLQHRAGDKLILDAGALNPGESRDVRLALTASEGGIHPLRAQVTADGGLVDEADTDVLVVAPKLAIKITGPKIRYVGRKATYRLTVSNSGSAISNNVRTKYKIPSGFRYVSSDRGGKYDATTNSIVWFVGPVNSGQSGEFNIQLMPNKLGDYSHEAGAVSENGESCTAQHKTRVEGVASLVLEIVDRDDPLELNSGTVYQIRVSNEGSKAATSVVLSCELPAGVRMIKAKGATASERRNGMLVFKGLRNLPPGKTAIYEVEVRSIQAGSHRFRARVASDSIQQPLVADELTQVYGD